MKKLSLVILAVTLLNQLPAFAQDTGIVGNVIRDFDLRQMAMRFLVNTASIFLLAYVVYFRRHKNKDFQFTLVLFN